jgi:hypothetical protein
MLIAKALGGSAGAFVVLAFALQLPGTPAFDLYMRDVYLVLTTRSFFLFCAFLCAIFAVLYFSVVYWTPRPPNKSLGLLSVALLLTSIVMFFAQAFERRKDLPHTYSEFCVVFGALLGFLSSLVLLVANLAFALVWTVLDKVRRRLSS